MDIDLSSLGKSAPLPPYRAVLAVDMENFSRTSAHHQQIIGPMILKVLEQAFTRSDMLSVWKNARFPRHNGDGYVMGADPEHLPFLIDPFLEELQRALKEVQPFLAAHDRSLRMRLRASIDVGPLPDLGDGSGIDAMGEAMISTHRLLDSDPVRDELKHTDPDTTLLATIVSRRVYEEVVLGGFTSISSARWKPVHASVPSKDFQAEGYLFVPTPSWGSPPEQPVETPGGGGRSDASGPASDSPDSPTVNQVGHNSGQMFQAGTVHGGVNFGGRDER
ncbi:hypothetical protein [Nocardiopsis xinjiangensis]|uniref:hypothetical protein n=1 Tax=Nocardiopsis xinjiangensis TaxID=124285 RepID=UPI000344D23B|nr:hypothetical protein [Nocardiopsis xinjiangensis]